LPLVLRSRHPCFSVPETLRSENHDPPKNEITKRKKAALTMALPGKPDRLNPATYPLLSATVAFFTDDYEGSSSNQRPRPRALPRVSTELSPVNHPGAPRRAAAIGTARGPGGNLIPSQVCAFSGRHLGCHGGSGQSGIGQTATGLLRAVTAIASVFSVSSFGLIA